MGEAATVAQPPRCLLLTGATGLVGGYLLSRLATDSNVETHVLVRSHDGDSPRRRLDQLGDYFGLERLAERITIHVGDLTAPGLGLPPSTLRLLHARITDVVHAAASISFADQEAHRRVNGEGTRSLLAAVGPTARFFYVSTAYVAGMAPALDEDQLDLGQGFRNGYERSKFVVEQMLRAAYAGRSELLTVLRPSVVLGEQATGRTFQFLTAYKVLRLLAAFAGRHPGGQFALQFAPEGTQNYIPVDRLTEMIVEVLRTPQRWGATYHLVNDAPVSNRVFQRLLEARFGIRLVNRRPDAACTPMNRAAVAATAAYLAYLDGEPRFGCQARNRLASAQAPMPFDEGYLDRLLDYCQHAAWGKKLAICR